MASLWLKSGVSVMMRTDLFSFLQAFTVSKYPRLHPTRHIRRLDVEAPASGLPIVFMSMHMSSLCMTPISILMQACRHPIPMFFFPYPPYPSFIHPPLSLGRHTHFLTQACRNQTSSSTPIFLSFILHPTLSLT